MRKRKKPSAPTGLRLACCSDTISARPAPRPFDLGSHPHHPFHPLVLRFGTMATSAPIGLTETAVQVVESATSTPAPLGMFGVLKRVASLPSRFIARVRLIDELLEQNAERQAAEIAAALNGTDMSHAPRLNYPSWFAGDRPMPGPWGFFTSWYVIGLALTVSQLYYA